MGLGPKGPRGLTESGIFERTSPFVLVPLLSLKHFSSALCRLSAYDCVRLCVCLCVNEICREKPSCDLDQQILGQFYFVFSVKISSPIYEKTLLLFSFRCLAFRLSLAV